jgi:hypothetical protein
MIHYSLKCSHGHAFDSWFQSASGYEKLRDSGMVSCAICGDTDVEKAMMAPRVRPARSQASRSEDSANGNDLPPPNSDTNSGADGSTVGSTVGGPPGNINNAVDPSVNEQHISGRGALSAPSTETQRALAELRAHVEANTVDVGSDFAAEARAMHTGDAPVRAIRGEARPEEAKSLMDDGVQVVPLPFSTSRKNN